MWSATGYPCCSTYPLSFIRDPVISSARRCSALPVVLARLREHSSPPLGFSFHPHKMALLLPQSMKSSVCLSPGINRSLAIKNLGVNLVTRASPTVNGDKDTSEGQFFPHTLDIYFSIGSVALWRRLLSS